MAKRHTDVAFNVAVGDRQNEGGAVIDYAIVEVFPANAEDFEFELSVDQINGMLESLTRARSHIERQRDARRDHASG